MSAEEPRHLADAAHRRDRGVPVTGVLPEACRPGGVIALVRALHDAGPRPPTVVGPMASHGA